MKVKLTLTTIWTVNPKDKELVGRILKEKPVDVIVDLFTEGLVGDKEIIPPTADVEIIEN